MDSIKVISEQEYNKLKKYKRACELLDARFSEENDGINIVYTKEQQKIIKEAFPHKYSKELYGGFYFW